MDKKQKRMRQERHGKLDEDWAENYVRGVEEKFPNAAGGLKYLYLDACFDETDDLETNAFEDSMEKLYQQLDSAPRLATSKVNEKVSSENAKLKAKIEESQQQMEEAKEKERAMEKHLEAARRKVTFPNKSWWPSGVNEVHRREGGTPTDGEIESLINEYGHESIVEVTWEGVKILWKVVKPIGQGVPVGACFRRSEMIGKIGDLLNGRTTYYRHDNPYKDYLPGPENKFTRVLGN